MKKCAALVLCAFTLLVLVSASAGLGTTRMEIGRSSAPEPTAVPGTELHDNVAYIKPGYKFVNRGDAVDVIHERSQSKTGTYVCRCIKDRSRKCQMVFTTRRITCRRGSCTGGSCPLTSAASTALQ